MKKLLRNRALLITLAVVIMWAALLWFSYQVGWLPYHGKSLWDTIIEPFVNWQDYFDESPIDFGNTTINIVIAVIFNVNLTFNFAVELFYLILNIQNAVRERLGKGDASLKRNKWGVVYNAVTKQPISQALVRLYDKDGQKLLKTGITSVNGVFNFHVEPGSYLVQVQKAGFTYPSTVVGGVEDPPWTKIYHGQTLTVTEETEIEIAVPLDPLEVNPIVKVWAQSWSRVSSFIITSNFVWLIGGFIYSIPTAIYYRDSLAGVLPFFAYITFFVLRFYQARLLPVNDGKVTDQHGDPVAHLPLAVFETDFGQLVTRIYTDDQGRYRFLVTQAPYLLRVMDQGYALVDDTGQPIPEIKVPATNKGKTMVINMDLRVQQLAIDPESLIANATKEEQRKEVMRNEAIPPRAVGTPTPPAPAGT